MRLLLLLHTTYLLFQFLYPRLVYVDELIELFTVLTNVVYHLFHLHHLLLTLCLVFLVEFE